jgi:iron complex outermembrane recepter protein
MISTLLLASVATAAVQPETQQPSVVDAEASIDAGPADIIITARRRSESLQDVPVAVSVLGGEALERQGAFNVARLQQIQPTVQFFSSNPRNSAINIRGIGAPFGLTNDGIEQGVGFYVDGVYIARIAASTLDFVDVERIEVLRGPQGTLYGKNTTAGAVSITTRRPGFEPEGRAELSVGNLGFVQAKGSVSGPIIADRLAARLSGSFTRRNGTLFNTVTDRRVNELDNLGFRGQLLWRATDGLEFVLAADWNRQDPEGFAQNYVKVVPTLRAPARQFANLAALSNYAPPSTNPFDRLVDADSLLTAVNTVAGASLTADWDLGAATLTSITAWRNWDWKPSNDRDFTGLPVTPESKNPSQQEQFTQEIRIASNGYNRLDYVAGLFYFSQSIDTQGVQQQGSSASLWLLGPTNGSDPALLDGLRSDNDIRYSNKSAALYGKITWNISDRFSIAPGLRVNYDRKDGVYNAIVSGGLPNPTPQQQALKNSVLSSQFYEVDFSDWSLSGDVTMTWKPADRILTYATYARSFRSGGINLAGVPNRADGVTPAVELATIEPETVDHFEIGFKSSFLGRAATVNVAVYRTDIRDFQTNVVSGAVGVLRGYLANVPKVRTQGVEADITVRPSRNIDGYINIAYTGARYLDFPQAPPPLELSGGSIAFVDASGGRLPGVSKWALGYGIETRLPIQTGSDLFAAIDGSLRSDFSSSPTPSRVLNVDGYVLTNVRAGYRGDRLEVFGWVRNAFDTQYFDFLTAAPGSTGLIVGQPGDPRTWGTTLSLRF